jgi:hypothetical protein
MEFDKSYECNITESPEHKPIGATYYSSLEYAGRLTHGSDMQFTESQHDNDTANGPSTSDSPDDCVYKSFTNPGWVVDNVYYHEPLKGRVERNFSEGQGKMPQYFRFTILNLASGVEQFCTGPWVDSSFYDSKVWFTCETTKVNSSEDTVDLSANGTVWEQGWTQFDTQSHNITLAQSWICPGTDGYGRCVLRPHLTVLPHGAQHNLLTNLTRGLYFVS